MHMKSLIRFDLSPKQSRTVERLLRALFSRKAIEPVTIERVRELGLSTLWRELKVGSDGVKVLLTESGLAARESLAELLYTACVNRDLCDRSDIAGALRDISEESWTKGQCPEDASELVHSLGIKIGLAVAEHTYVVPIRGVNLVGVESVRLGTLTMHASAQAFLAGSIVAREVDLHKKEMSRLLTSPCLSGIRVGTSSATIRWYKEQAFLAAGMLAVDAGAVYERGATAFCIRPEFDDLSGGWACTHLYWNNNEKSLGRSYSGARGHVLELSAERASQLTEPGAFVHAFEILQKSQRTELEDAITRAVYWYGDAHRDAVPVMQFVKYWSCLESLLGGPGDNLTETLAVSVVIVLTYGHFRLLKDSDRDEHVRTVKRLYGLRSRAVHRASHSHVSHRDVVLISVWAAWLIYNTISFANAGMPDTRTLWKQVRQLRSDGGPADSSDASSQSTSTGSP